MLVQPKLQPAVGIPTTLAVVVHGLSRRTIETVPPVVAQLLPSADILTPLYNAGRLSNADARTIAWEISEAIDRQWHTHQSKTGSEYQRIILIGHSRGALMVRKAYVIACGAAGDLAREGMIPAPKPWRTAVERSSCWRA
jgi:predicted esterase